MKVIARYISWEVFVGMIIAAVILLPLFSFFDLIDQLDDVGKGTYGIKDAFLYMLMLVPRRFIQLAPFIALLGTVGALGVLAVNLELVALRVAGLSPLAISLPAVGVGLLLTSLIVGLEYLVAPQLQQKATVLRAVALEQSVELGRGLGIWTRDAQNILRIGEMLNQNLGRDIEIIHFSRQGTMTAHVQAQYADIIDDGLWKLHEVTVRTFTPEKIAATHTSIASWRSFLGPEDVATLTKPPESLTPLELMRHTEFLQDTGQQADAYLLALWRKAGAVVMTTAMVLVAIPFVFGSVREGLSGKLVLASLMGIGVYLLDQIIANAGLAFHLNPIFTSLSPGLLLIAVAGYWLLRRVA
ncbi:MAG TPA: LPS export ABC transporter permease LptG [Nitrosomonas mobilis]|uniref:Putative membrane protein n=1 Tax=Nitrosomonas mobilis TaxID=51642 RepID=A0A1G5SF79_9PROT|nr:LPS export ABC transporter permease LptG [Nitrosomonas mobilis]SCZ85856.1 putative membrane protein [Nitrosomonas mobilis]HNO76022.1 LPS export ABC transporter permease LptG [Nitrosomonas mobilis]